MSTDAEKQAAASGVRNEPRTDPELEALRVVIAALMPLNIEAQKRVMAYVMRRFGITAL